MMNIYLWDKICLIFLCIIKVTFCDDELDGHTSYYVYHSLEPSGLLSSPIYELRGIITYFSNRNEAIYTEDNPLSSIQIEKLKKLAETGDIYRLKVSSKLIKQSPEIDTTANREKDSVFSFTIACAIYQWGLSDVLTLTLDQSGLPVGVSISPLQPFCTENNEPDTKVLHFNTSVNIVTLVNAPAPDTLTYIQRLEQEKAEKARGEQGDNRSFLAKYWMYIVPFVIFVFISGASSPEGQAGGR
ncbi:ER membrane protein complex subunit 10 [Trichonephila clavata]|uniref:ER membrane protein complex subunit 10 n=1 Tax=Trichonephila clavata TaxID=2740835 RepID=A0A8X6GFY7_TRICU|nr:ER membrane protein complex subunit 10 [Trichonephila clavata]